MRLRLERREFSAEATLGVLYIDDVEQCYTLEDRDRDGGDKVLGATAIPYGLYTVTIDYSQRFKRLMPHLLDVPGFSGIRIHCGNTSADTAGCILLGETVNGFVLGKSRQAYEKFWAKLRVPATIQITKEF